MPASCRWYFHTRHEAAHVSPGGVPLGAGFSESTDDPPGALEFAAVVTEGSRSSFLLGLDSLGTKLSDSVAQLVRLLCVGCAAKETDAVAGASSLVAEAVTSIRTVMAYSLQDRLTDLYRTFLDQTSKAQVCFETRVGCPLR